MSANEWTGSNGLVKWGVLVVAGLFVPAALAEIPRGLKGIVMGDRHRPVQRVTLHGVAFDSLNCFSELPYLLWPAESKQPFALAPQAEAVRAWLEGASRELGHEGFTLRYVETFDFRGNTVLSFELVRRGMRLHDARVMAHFSGKTFLGIQNHLDGKIVGIEDAPVAEGNEPQIERVYYPARAGDGLVRAVAAKVERVRQHDRTIVTVAGDDEIFETEISPDEISEIRPRNARFTEYRVPQGSFPDQISVAEDGIVWFSQPNNDSITSFDPETATFTQHNTNARGGRGPDGLIVGSQGRVWSGMYFTGSLGWWDAWNNTMNNVAGPYAPAALAIPVETSDGSIWVTDHQYNKISEFNPVSQTWIRTVTMPTPNCWVVQGHEDVARRHVYFTEYSANKLGRLTLGTSTVVDINTLGGGPAFCVYADNKVYYSRWLESGIGVYDVVMNNVTEYNFPVANEGGGPLWLRPNGDIACGTLNRGYVMLFDVETLSFTSFQVPTANPGFKDGLTVNALDGVIWFTESGANKIGRLDLDHLKPIEPAP